MEINTDELVARMRARAQTPEDSGNVDAGSVFAMLRAERTSDAGRAAVQMAAYLFARAGGDTQAITEARAWVKLGLECDKAVADGNLAAALEKAKRKAQQHEVLDRAKAIAAGNVVSMPGRGGG